MIRNAKREDIEVIMDIYENAKIFMRNNGNKNQWNAAYPQRELILEDIEKKQCFVVVEDDEVVAVFAFIIGEDPTYHKIENGSWRFQKPYGTIHRIASSGKVRNISKICYDFCLSKIDYLRADTHHDNKVMQTSLLRYGFQECGIIYIADGSPRIAYDYHI